MPISGWVMTLSQDEAAQAMGLEALVSSPGVTLGERTGDRLPVVLETESADEDRAMLEWLQALPGVSLLELVYMDMSDIEPYADAGWGDGLRRRTGDFARPEGQEV